ncbi:ClpXP protease specificity-enhancing factor [uncultured Xylophilus sp.]|uniref:ClpXP protease specificity-enhancing factor n=1 Tax=uncultured Xylophilus sp. TaxID=296832 RepID=UPI0025E8D35D|nr:ClpXP protease specificity-enhancing factor [uncultured Xylophilus sp.]
MNALESTSTRPYLIRALYEWCTDNGLTPYVAVRVDDSVQVPREYVKNGEIVLNVSYDATSALQIGNDFIEFKARFGGTPRDILVPIGRVMAIYARENGQGMAFPLFDAEAAVPGNAPVAAARAPAADAGADNRVVSLLPADDDAAPVPAEALDEAGDDTQPPRPPSPGGARPALKRVK